MQRLLHLSVIISFAHGCYLLAKLTVFEVGHGLSRSYFMLHRSKFCPDRQPIIDLGLMSLHTFIDIIVMALVNLRSLMRNIMLPECLPFFCSLSGIAYIQPKYRFNHSSRPISGGYLPVFKVPIRRGALQSNSVLIFV